MSKGIVELDQNEINGVSGAPVGAIIRLAAKVIDKAVDAYKAATSKQGKAVASTAATVAEYGPSGSTPQE